MSNAGWAEHVDQIQAAPERLDELPDWFGQLGRRRMRRLWVPVTVAAIMAELEGVESGDRTSVGTIARIANALVAVRDHSGRQAHPRPRRAPVAAPADARHPGLPYPDRRPRRVLMGDDQIRAVVTEAMAKAPCGVVLSHLFADNSIARKARFLIRDGKVPGVRLVADERTPGGRRYRAVAG